jgi:hypothetical protein
LFFILSPLDKFSCSSAQNVSVNMLISLNIGVIFHRK